MRRKNVTKSGLLDSVPSWLETPPNPELRPPTQTRAQMLPFGELTWQDFERLCLRLVRQEADVEYCQLYGEPGQGQDGIDIYARTRSGGKYRVYQCKNVKNFGPSKIKAAVTRFVEGDWADKTENLVLCTRESVRDRNRAAEIEAQNLLLQERRVSLITWDSNYLSEVLKEHPKLVDDFFSRAWVVAFCGQEEADKLGKRLDIRGLNELRAKLAAFYKHLFNLHDPGLPTAPGSNAGPLRLEERFVLPDVYDRRTIITHSLPDKGEGGPTETRPAVELGGVAGSDQAVKQHRVEPAQSFQRVAAERWLESTSTSVVLGEAGSGKSSLLRFIAMDVLEKSPRSSILAAKWGQFIPVWIPFARWSRGFSDTAGKTSSVKEFLADWFKSWDEERLVPLVERGLEDERILVLVDGLDEWANLTGAGVALNHLQVFIERRKIPAILSARPRGFDRLGMSTTGWELAELADLSVHQQEVLCKAWFTHNARGLSDGQSYSEEQVGRRSAAETATFLAEVRTSPALGELAKNPLLLTLLVYHRLFNAALPPSRFKAYNSLVDHLISEHPRRRTLAASVIETPIELDVDDVRGIFGRVAYVIQRDFPEGLIPSTTAATVAEAYLQNTEYGLGLPLSEARRVARQVLRIGEDSLGLVVKKSQDELGFFHRSFQQYLAAAHLSRRSLTRQLEMVESHCVDPQWHEVILGLFHLATRGEDVAQFVNRVKSKQVDTVGSQARSILLCEAAVGDFNCPVSLARQLIANTVDEIELAWWMPLRERLLLRLLEGLSSTRFRDTIRSRLLRWFPSRTRWRRDIFREMAAWPHADDVFSSLWRGVHDEHSANQRAAAQSLALWAAGDAEIGSRVSSVLHQPFECGVQAAAIEALLTGWPSHEGLKDTLKSARSSLSPELRLVSIKGRVHLGVHTEEDRQELMSLASHWWTLGSGWKDEVPIALLTGWPGSSSTKADCLKYLTNRPGLIEETIGYKVLLEGYAGDEDVATFFVEAIKDTRYPLYHRHGLHELDVFGLLASNFRDHIGLVKAIDEALPKMARYNFPEVAKAALVGRTPAARSMLLGLFAARGPYWFAESLIDGWGIDDPEVGPKITELAFGPAKQASGVAHLLPRIITNQADCRKRLLELLKDPECPGPYAALDGLRSLGPAEPDGEVVDIVLARGREFYEESMSKLVSVCGSDERVRNIAKQILKDAYDCKRSAPYDFHAVMAAAYGDDEEVRGIVRAVATPLPAILRETIATRLGEGAGGQEFAIDLLGLFKIEEEDDDVKIQASIGYHTILASSDMDIQSALTFLSEEIAAVGPDFEERRQAAFAGLVALRRLDIMVSAQERDRDRYPVTVSLGRMSPNVPLLRHVLQNWEYIRHSFSDDVWLRMSGSYHSDPGHTWEMFCPFADEYPAARNEAVAFLRNGPQDLPAPSILRFLGRVLPKSRLLLEYCLQGLQISSDEFNDRSIAAAELIAPILGAMKRFYAVFLKASILAG
jgi:hypothetical protein